MKHNTGLRVISLSLLLVTASAGLLPFLATHTALTNGWGNLHVQLLGFQLLDIRGQGSQPSAIVASRLLWATAIVAELVLIAATFKPVHFSRYRYVGKVKL